MAENVASNLTSKIGEMSAVVDSYVGPVLKNNYFKGALFLFFGLYAGFLAPALPNSVLHFFDTVVGKLLFIFLIAFIATRQIDGSIGVALIVAVMFLLTLTVLNNVKMNESFRNLGMEHFELMNQMRDVVSEQFAVEPVIDPLDPVSRKAARDKCLKCVMDLSKEDQTELQSEFCKHEQISAPPAPVVKSTLVPVIPPVAVKSTEHFESHYANFDL